MNSSFSTSYETSDTGGANGLSWKLGKIKGIRMAGTHTSTWEVGTTYTLFTLDEKYYPTYTVSEWIIYKVINGTPYVGMLTVNTDGTVTLTPQTVTAGGTIRFYNTYI